MVVKDKSAPTIQATATIGLVADALDAAAGWVVAVMRRFRR
jgi:hypothetical protein